MLDDTIDTARVGFVFTLVSAIVVCLMMVFLHIGGSWNETVELREAINSSSLMTSNLNAAKQYGTELIRNADGDVIGVSIYE